MSATSEVGELAESSLSCYAISVRGVWPQQMGCVRAERCSSAAIFREQDLMLRRERLAVNSKLGKLILEISLFGHLPFRG